VDLLLFECITEQGYGFSAAAVKIHEAENTAATIKIIVRATPRPGNHMCGIFVVNAADEECGHGCQAVFSNCRGFEIQVGNPEAIRTQYPSRFDPAYRACKVRVQKISVTRVHLLDDFGKVFHDLAAFELECRGDQAVINGPGIQRAAYTVNLRVTRKFGQ
jgi:hypothetical protein